MPTWDSAFIFEVAALREAWPDILRSFPPRWAATACHRPYQTLVCCPPVAWFQASGLVLRTVEAMGR